MRVERRFRRVAMAMQDIAAAMQRAAAVYRRRPEAALHDDAPATARWEGGTRVGSLHPSGARVPTDMPAELGGSGDHVTPGWLFRAGLASCAATRIAMAAAAEGIELDTLEVVGRSRSDTRGLLGLPDADGTPVCAGSRDLQLHVRIAARDVAPQRLHALVEHGLRCSPVYAGLRGALPVALQVDVGAV
jgi:uncharacterized OsmC-like protein